MESDRHFAEMLIGLGTRPSSQFTWLARDARIRSNDYDGWMRDDEIHMMTITTL